MILTAFPVDMQRFWISLLIIIIRMEKRTGRSFKFEMPGIVLIDEIETHLHLELQKRILDLLTTIFPNIQFIVSTHSPFILNSLENVVIYDLENHLLVRKIRKTLKPGWLPGVWKKYLI